MKGNSQYLKMIDLGSLKNLAQFAKCPIFSQKPIHPTGPDAMVHILQYVWLLGISGLKTRYLLTGSVFMWQQTRLFLGQCMKPYHKSIAQKSRCYKTATGNKCWLDKRNLHPVYPSWALWKQQCHILVRTCRSPKLTFSSVHLFDDNSWQNVCIRLKMSEKQRAEWKQRLELRWFVCLGTTVFILLGWL